MKYFYNKNRIAGHNSGFTLIETLVAIAILLVAVASPLIVSQRGIAAANSAKEQMIAYYLAQDATEQIRAIRDNNSLVSPKRDWLDGLSQCTNTASCTIDLYGNPAHSVEFSSVNSGPLKFDATNSYYRYTTGVDTPFARVFYLTPELANNGEVLVNVEVTWSSGGVPHRVVIQSRIFNIR